METTKDLDTLIDVAARAIDLPVESEWKPDVKAHLEVLLRLAAVVEQFKLPDEAEPAPVFEA
jgi:RNAse (barnase) inhibitor barstar